MQTLHTKMETTIKTFISETNKKLTFEYHLFHPGKIILFNQTNVIYKNSDFKTALEMIRTHLYRELSQ